MGEEMTGLAMLGRARFGIGTVYNATTPLKGVVAVFEIV